MIFAWIGALLVGVSLGLLGSGGSILTVPLLIYLVGEHGKVAIAESLGIVAGISTTGFIPLALKKKVHWKSVILFGLPGMCGAYVGAFLAHYITITVQLLLFAGVMLLAAIMMFRDRPSNLLSVGHHISWWIIALEGLIVGVLAGVVGVGGGFLIVPALVLLGGLSMDLAVGTSLTIIALQSATGFFKHLDVLEALGLSVNIELMLIFIFVGGIGSWVGRRIGTRISNTKLRRSFAIFLVVMGSYIIYMNAFSG